MLTGSFSHGRAADRQIEIRVSLQGCTESGEDQEFHLSRSPALLHNKVGSSRNTHRGRNARSRPFVRRQSQALSGPHQSDLKTAFKVFTTRSQEKSEMQDQRQVSEMLASPTGFEPVPQSFNKLQHLPTIRDYYKLKERKAG